MGNPWTLNFWQSGEYQVVREKLDEETAKGFRTNPERRSLFRALTLVPEKSVRVAIIGQDPYPQHHLSTGVAFSIPSDVGKTQWPPTLRTILSEYQKDLGYTCPDHGNLERWCQQGVLLWNAIPSCREGASLSHDWPGGEWSYLTSEIVSRLSRKGIVFAFLGTVAKRYVDLVDVTNNEILLTSHPSPRGSMNSKTPFLGSRLFSCINDKLVSQGLDPIDWRLDGSNTQDLPRTDVGGSRILDNVTGADLGGLPLKHGPNTYLSSFEPT